MASEKQANKARELYSDLLVKRGAHAIGVADGQPYGKRGFVVVVHVAPHTSHKIPNKLKGDLDGKPFEVDVVTVTSEPFAPE
jgi:hypothetical protein